MFSPLGSQGLEPSEEDLQAQRHLNSTWSILRGPVQEPDLLSPQRSRPRTGPAPSSEVPSQSWTYSILQGSELLSQSQDLVEVL
ncbi:unnamed protein product [Arctogadus glacialis]